MIVLDIPGTAIDLSYVIHHEDHKKCHFISDTSELRSALLSTFPFSTKFLIYKYRHLHIPNPKLDNSEDESQS